MALDWWTVELEAMVSAGGGLARWNGLLCRRRTYAVTARTSDVAAFRA
jgi:hypothetical protein